ncbi:MAG: SAF domain-containing protein [Actinomycetota bacterium]
MSMGQSLGRTASPTGASPLAPGATPPPPGAQVAKPGQATSLNRRRRWRPGLFALGLATVAAAAIGGIILVQSVSQTESVLVAATDLQRGQVLQVSDVRVADVAVSPDVNVLKLSEQAFLGGESSGEPVRVLRGFVPAGTVLSEDHFQEQNEALAADEALIGLRLESGSYPSLLQVGDSVEIYVVAERVDDATAEFLGVAEVWTMWQTPSEEDRTEDLVADLVVNQGIRAEALQAHSEGRLRLTLISGS